ncbi:hypothetical protein QYE76_013776 [Lolium multiflorum]|uniref:Retrotransposon protein n=1 Tax=Lolium multiflorum TaxID=4521 RepID=A0AAD8U4S9_LOLMU|nr:hypothetical protein QYE76_013776 [Lolium multiflorum]
MTKEARRGSQLDPRWAQTTWRRGPGLAAPPWCVGAPQPLSPPFLRVLLRPEDLSHRGYLTKSYSRLCGAENTREKRALRRAGIRRGNSLPEGEIDAIAIVIELDIISIIIIIISTIYTAITTAAPRHRSHAVSLTSRYQSDPGMEHWTAVKNILKYLKRTKDMFLCYGGDQELVVTSYTDASWNTDPDDSKSQSGYVFILNGAAVSWASSKQCTVAKSSTESEYIAASEASSEAVWMKRFIVELGVVPSALDPLVIYCDNMGAIANAHEPRSHKRLKHIKLRYHSIREYIEDGEVKICKVHTDLNVADPLTKALPRAKHDQHQNAMGVRYLTM